MKRSPEEEGRRWLEQTEEDLDSARYLFEGGKYYLVCFMAQQTAEKALKSYLYFKGEEAVTGHSVEQLCRRAAAFDRHFERLHQSVAVLDGFYVPTRYPNNLPDSIPARVFTKRAAAEALRLAERTVSAVKSIMGPGKEG